MWQKNLVNEKSFSSELTQVLQDGPNGQNGDQMFYDIVKNCTSQYLGDVNRRNSNLLLFHLFRPQR